MSPPDDAPPLARLARWSEWWFTPRWRALLTWLALVAITAAVYHANFGWIEETSNQPIAYLNRFLSVPLPSVFNFIPSGLTYSLLIVWFQPLVLRLSLGCGLAWIGLRFASEILLDFFFSSGYLPDWLLNANDFGLAALQCWVLLGWRSRPWMWLLAQALGWALWKYAPISQSFDEHWHWIKTAAVELPVAALMLYGTRLLRPEERALGTRPS